MVADASSSTRRTATLVVLADQDGLVTTGTVAGAPALVTIRSWPMLAEWTVQSKDGQLRTIVRRFPASLLTAGGTLDLDLLPAHGVVPPATVTYAQSLAFGLAAITDNGDGTLDLSGTLVTDNLDGTLTIGT